MKTMPQSESLVKDMLHLMEVSRDGFGQGRVYLRAVLRLLARGMHINDIRRAVGRSPATDLLGAAEAPQTLRGKHQ